MEFPDSANTNVYHLADFAHVEWTILIMAHPTVSYPNGFQSLGEPSANVLQPKIEEILAEATNALRMSGFYSLFDEPALAIWVFEIPNHNLNDSDRSRRRTCLADLISSYRLIKKTAGTLRSSDLSQNPGSKSALDEVLEASQQSSGVLEELNMQGFDANSQIGVSKHSPNRHSDIVQSMYEYASIRFKFSVSFLMSLLSSICIDGSWLRIGANCCIGPLQDQAHENESAEPERLIGELSLLSVALLWHPTGKLCITGCKVSATGLRRVSEYYKTLGSILRLLGSIVTLAPSGARAVLMGHAKDESRGMRRIIRARLRQQNINISSETEWVKLRIPSEDAAGFPVVTVWPDSLCFVRSDEHTEDYRDNPIGGPDVVTKWIDPLEDAERWYLERSARANALEAKRIADGRLAAIARGNHESDDEEALVFNEGISHGRLNLQDMSGVYPTPPDGAPIPLHSVAITQEQANQLEAGTSTSNAVNFDPEVSSLSASPNYDETASCKNDGNGDLFGEIDSEMFAANELTEDDFNFFDEPSPSEGRAVDVEFPSNSQELPSREYDTHSSTHRYSSSLHSPVVSYVEAAETKADDSIRALPDDQYIHLDANLKQNPATPGLDTTSNGSKMPENLALEASEKTANNDYSQLQRSVDLQQTRTHGNEEFLSGSEQQAFELREIDQKYDDSGHFGFDNIDTPEGVEPGRLSTRERLAIMTTQKLRDSISSPSESSSDSDQDPESKEDTTENLKSGETPDSSGPASIEMCLQASLKRKREESLGKDAPVTPSGSYGTPGSPHYHMQDPVAMPKLVLFTATSLISLEEHLNPLKEQMLEVDRPSTLQGQQTYLRVAQILTDQFARSDTKCSEFFSNVPVASDQLGMDSEYIQNDSLEAVLHRVYPGAKQFNLRQFLILEDEYPQALSKETAGSQSSKKRFPEFRQLNTSVGDRERHFRITTPFACVRRMDSQIDISVSALQFWEELGLAPASSEKHIVAYCIHPESTFIEERALCFLESVKGAYQSCKLGTHRLGLNSTGHDGTFVSVPMNAGDTSASDYEILEACENLGRKLAASSNNGTDFVIYIVNPSSNPSNLPRLCKAFLKLFEVYASTLKGKDQEDASDVILHILPLASIASREGLVIPPPVAYKKVAFEVYSKCAPRKDFGKTSPYSCASAVQLAGTIPKSINFNLSSTPTPNLLHADRCIHVGYCWYPYAQWLSASWTDNQGCQQWSACYRIAMDRTQSWPTFEEAAKELWDITMDIIDSKSAPSRVFIAKSSTMSRQEMDAWLSVSSQTSHNISLTLVAVDECPELQFPPYVSALLSPINQNLATPASTPAANIVSPEQSGYPSTPGVVPLATNLPTPAATSFDHDHEARLVDIREETWGLATDFAPSNTLLDSDKKTTVWCPALLSGQLIKRAGVRDEDGLVNLGVDILHAQQPSHALLKEVLTMYGCLGTLARIRGIVDPVKSVLPWHLATVKKSQVALQVTGL